MARYAETLKNRVVAKVAIADGQYEFQARVFKSLSLIAREITGCLLAQHRIHFGYVIFI